MRHHQQAQCAALQIVFKPFGHIKVQMVGRLVKNQQVGFVYQHIGQCHTFDLPSRQLPDGLVEITNLELRKDLLGFLLIVPCIGMIHAREQLVHPGIARCLHAPLILTDKVYRFVSVIETGLQHGQPFGINRSLLQISPLQVTAEHDASFVISLLSGKDIQEGGFSASVFRYQSDTLALGYAKSNFFKKYQIAERLGESVYL